MPSLGALAIGALLLLLGRRGRVIGDDPYCRTCGFDLHGRNPDSSKCPECGTDLTPKAIRIGEDHRRPSLNVAGRVLIALGMVGVAYLGWVAFRDYDWAPWKPTTWLLRDVEQGTSMSYSPAIAELDRRIESDGSSQEQVNLIVDRALAHQADRTKPWDDNWMSFIIEAKAAGRLTDDRATRCLQQGISASISIKPRIRRGQNATVVLKFKEDRMLPETPVVGRVTDTSYTLGPVSLSKSVSASDVTDSDLASRKIFDHIVISANAVASLPNGRHMLTATVGGTVRSVGPDAGEPVPFRISAAQPVDLLAANAIVDDFKAEDKHRQTMRDTISTARVTTKNGLSNVSVMTGRLPVAIAVDVVLVQGGQEERIGALRSPAHFAPNWSHVLTTQKSRFSGRVDVHLRPSQAAADDTENLDQYWGEAIVIKDVIVDAPYVAPFSRDERFRVPVEQAVVRPTMTRDDGNSLGVRLNLYAWAPPVKLAFIVYVAADGKEYRQPIPWVVLPNSNQGLGVSVDDLDPRVTECDVILRPDPDWEIHTGDLDPPWGHEIVFKNVKIESPKASP